MRRSRPAHNQTADSVGAVDASPLRGFWVETDKDISGENWASDCFDLACMAYFAQLHWHENAVALLFQILLGHDKAIWFQLGDKPRLRRRDFEFQIMHIRRSIFPHAACTCKGTTIHNYVKDNNKCNEPDRIYCFKPAQPGGYKGCGGKRPHDQTGHCVPQCRNLKKPRRAVRNVTMHYMLQMSTVGRDWVGALIAQTPHPRYRCFRQ